MIELFQMDNKNVYRQHHSVDLGDYRREEQYRHKSGSLKLWRASSLTNIVSYTKKKNYAIYESFSVESENSSVSSAEITKNIGISKRTKSGNVTVSIVLIEAKGLPEPPEDASSHVLYCKIRLGLETLRSKYVSHTRLPEWRERFELTLQNDNLLRISLWDKGKLKNFMGRCVLDLSRLERERTHEIWQQLDDGFGCIHLSITMCTTVSHESTSDEQSISPVFSNKNGVYDLTSSWKLVGQLQVKVIMAKGLNAKSNAYCVLELDNERVQTHSSRGLVEPIWNKNYIFNVYDVTSTLDLKVYDDSSLVNSLRNEPSGKISIPLLRIRNGEARWYALKDKNKRNIAKGNCPRILLEMSLIWNPVKASMTLFRPKDVKHIKESPKFDIALAYKNLEFVRDTFEFLYCINEYFKRLFEWDNQEMSAVALIFWLMFWHYFSLWMVPLILLAPFMYFWAFNTNQQEKSFMRGYSSIEISAEQNESDKLQSEKSFTGKIQNIAEMTATVTNGVEYIASLAERLYNLASFKLPFLSYLAMLLLIISSVAFYLIQCNYLMMALGIYKFTRKYMNPHRVLNNDLLDFLSRIPDNEILKDWRELSVPEPAQTKRILGEKDKNI